jgi:hypothetical protein
VFYKFIGLINISHLQAQYKKNLSFGGFDDDLLTSIYEEVEDDEIKIHKEHMCVRLHDNTWRHLYDEARRYEQSVFGAFIFVCFGDGLLFKFCLLNFIYSIACCMYLLASFNNEHFYFTIASAQHYDSLFFNSIWRKINAATKHCMSERIEEVLVNSMSKFSFFISCKSVMWPVLTG